MKVNYAKSSKEFLFKLKDFISENNHTKAKQYTLKLVSRITDMLQHPYIGKVNATFDDESIREIILDGIKIIYKIHPKSVNVVMMYRYIDFNELEIDTKS
ncbi:type II toxin-antitoxin system RelE/ParE family toxin [Candidatus Sulfurimonas marisnigri]|uniref:Type II toxin-antitoxin system RelE/ParE family toxin n=1 Tax=Candidatus Sulfurimonas marisnigri TaxID=2740405 RepID=A0A7S7RQ48_9BACT|nr:type II toxin-antitoxin system RelE/ParE family toxin [Candidatus Sulfurimonas marisnigri]QOY54239.1 type II toxin-antitoxin system RelE/ParE family toxin [Candidatus Sulfurimonas marisnigri]